MDGNWNTVVYNPTILDESERVIQGVATAPVYDRQNELITVDAIRKAIPDFMVLPVLTVQHSQYVAGRVDDVWIDDQDRMCIKAHLKQTRDVDQVWELIKAGKLNAFSITGMRISSTCNRFNKGTPCVTDDLVLNSITICGDNKVNPEAHFDMVIKSIITGDEINMVEEIATPTVESTTPETTNVDIAKAVVTELKESGVLLELIKSCKEGEDKKEEKKEEKEEEKEDKFEKAFAEISTKLDELSAKYDTLQKSVTALEESPVEKAQFVVTDDNKIAQVIPQMDVAKANSLPTKVTARTDALLKMRLS